MRIVSDFHDYYDTAIGFGGVDNTIVYNRKTETILNPREPLFHMDWGMRHSIGDFDRARLVIPDPIYDPFNGLEHVHYGAIVFCGKTYPVLERIGKVYQMDKWEELDISSKVLTRLRDMWAKPLMQKDYSELNLTFKAPVIFNTSARRMHNPLNLPGYHMANDIVLNPQLGPMGFASCVPPFEAFQELHMFLGNYFVGVAPPQTTPMTEKQKVAQKGMDKWSFRKMKGS